MSESEEMYLITIARLREGGAEEPIPVSQIADELSLQPVSVNQMVRKLEQKGLVSYQPYKGVALSPAGREQAMRILRNRRLWEVFLVENLKLSYREADALACHMEHITPDEVVERLAGFLGEPTVTPYGLPIPNGDAKPEINASQSLDQLEAGQRGEVMQISADESTRAFLHAEGIRPGAAVIVLGTSSRGNMLLSLGENRLSLSKELASQVRIQTSAVKLSPA